MTADFSSGLARELLDDFYAECEEQLGILRDLLTEIESSGGETTAARYEPLFRNMHSLKGNAAVVGLREAEELAHAAEDYLRGLTRREITLSESGGEVLLQAVHRLELTISAHRHQSTIPAVSDLVSRLKQLAAPGLAPAAVSIPSEIRSTNRAPVTGEPISLRYRFTFSPTRDLDSRGININLIRSRLAALGTIISSKPLITGGAIMFEFMVSLISAPEASEWNEMGVAFAEITEVAAAVVPAPTSASLPAAEDQGASLFIAPSHIVRVDIGRLDDLLRIAGELVIHRSRLDDRISQGVTDRGALKEVNLALTRSLRELREAITRVRLVPLAEVFARLPFVIRDLARASTKKARLVVEGKHTEIDKYLVERLKEPLLHLVRNAFSHGIETTEQRLAAGKPAEGTIILSAAAAAGYVLIRICDDGAGVDPAGILQRAKALKIPVPETIDDKTLLDLLCAPGFSTRTEVDRAAGRGVGMTVVRDVVQQLGGSLSMQTVRFVSTQFTLRLPLTLSIVETLLFSVAGQTCAVPQSVVQEIVEVDPRQIQPINQTLVMPYRDAILPVMELGRLFGGATEPGKQVKPVLVIRSELGFAGLIVDRVIGHREVVVRPMEDPLIQARGIAGATELGDGRPVLILDALALVEGAARPHPQSARRNSSSTLPELR